MENNLINKSSTFQNTLRSWRRDKWQINFYRRVQYPAVEVLDKLIFAWRD